MINISDKSNISKKIDYTKEVGVNKSYDYNDKNKSHVVIN